jgi:uncharacterized protein (DUF362 family)
MAQSVSQQTFSRRDLLRTALKLGGLTVASRLLAACGRAGQATPTLLPAASPTLTPSSTITPGPMATPSPTTAPTLTVTPSPTATPIPTPTPEAEMASVAFVKTRDRAAGVQRALQLLGLNPVQGKQVLLKPNFNSADPAPASTHPDTLRTLVEELWGMGALSITVAERSGVGSTRTVMEKLGVFEMAGELGFETLVLNELHAREDWVMIEPPGSHWKQGFPFARVYLEAETIVQVCCLKTHQYGGHFTMSLKNSVGMVAQSMPGMENLFMAELHASSHQRAMIAEINTAYTPALIVLDGVEAFTTGGPMTGQQVASEVVLAGTDRVAIDAVGVALLRYYQTTYQVAQGPIFQQDQIARAVELGLGVDRPEKIRLVTDDPDSESYAAEIREVLLRSDP